MTGTDSTLALIDAAATDRVLLVGSLPPAGRDVDILVRAADAHRLADALRSAGFQERGGSWARFRSCSAEVVDLISVENWRLPDTEVERLYAEAIPLDGAARVVRPAPADALLVLARIGGGALSERRRRRAHDALTEWPDAWQVAHARAPSWRLANELASLEDAYLRPRTSPPIHLRRVAGAARRLRSPTVVALSGLDGAGKSLQARGLQEALHRLGYDATVEWVPLGQQGVIERASTAARRGLRALRRLGLFADLERRTAAGESLVARAGAGGRGTAGPTPILHTWAGAVALVNAAAHLRPTLSRRGRRSVVIFDRYILDSIVRLRYLYGADVRLDAQARLVEALSPTPTVAFFLDVSPEAALRRKQDQWSLHDLHRQAALYREEAARLSVERLDGERPPHELCADIAARVWDALP